MSKLNFDKLYFLYFNLFLFFAGVIAIYERYWIILSFTVLTFFIFYFPYFFGFIKKFQKMSAFEYSLVIFVYFLIFIKTFHFGTTYFIYQVFFFRVLHNLVFSFLISILCIFLFYSILSDKKYISSINQGLLILFIFSFSVCFVTFIEVFKYFMNYFFGISILSYNLSASLGFITIHFFGSFSVFFFVYLYLAAEDKNKIIFYFKKFFGFKSSKLYLTKELILDLISGGESELVEFKESLCTNLNTNKLDKKIENSVLKTITAFLNSNGGILFIGVSELGEISGLDADNFKSDDKCKLQLANLIKKQLGADILSNITIDAIYFEDKYILKVEVVAFLCEVFLLWEKNEEFYIRAGPSSVKISGSELIGYIRSKFSK
jgi:hypothetical protein